jgi:uncharacterized protein
MADVPGVTSATRSVCQLCGACCAALRVSFYWREAPQRGLSDALVEKVSPHLVSMRGTNRREPRCAALEGEIGKEVACRVYQARPSPCRELQPGEEKCNRARARHGLAPLAGPTASGAT